MKWQFKGVDEIKSINWTAPNLNSGLLKKAKITFWTKLWLWMVPKNIYSDLENEITYKIHKGKIYILKIDKSQNPLEAVLRKYYIKNFIDGFRFFDGVKERVVIFRPKPKWLPAKLYIWLISKLFVVADKHGFGPYVTFAHYRSLDEQMQTDYLASILYAD